TGSQQSKVVSEPAKVRTRLHSESDFYSQRSCIRTFSLDSKLPRFERLFDVGEEAFGVRAVNDAMVEREREVGHMTNGNQIVALFSRDHFRAFLDCADAEDGDLWLIDDRCAEETAEHTGIRNGERAACNLVGFELFGACAVGQIVCGAGEAGD